ncbi:hypothetical protein CW304_02735 [Bacillus sp. UFRGS-B20]|nr:hypothetical protein CW304_02735 [Bacillus sp. UFRGS-B20]
MVSSTTSGFIFSTLWFFGYLWLVNFIKQWFPHCENFFPVLNFFGFGIFLFKNTLPFFFFFFFFQFF